MGACWANACWANACWANTCWANNRPLRRHRRSVSRDKDAGRGDHIGREQLQRREVYPVGIVVRLGGAYIHRRHRRLGPQEGAPRHRQLWS
ncbi:MAG: hypothetical protein Tsb0020_31640 [Haliangiales bacterium]